MLDDSWRGKRSLVLWLNSTSQTLCWPGESQEGWFAPWVAVPTTRSSTPQKEPRKDYLTGESLVCQSDDNKKDLNTPGGLPPSDYTAGGVLQDTRDPLCHQHIPDPWCRVCEHPSSLLQNHILVTEGQARLHQGVIPALQPWAEGRGGQGKDGELRISRNEVLKKNTGRVAVL